jgi:multiple sugar transport system permease protein
MATAATTQAGAGAGTTPTTAKRTDSGPKTPWWMWVCIVALVLYCLFPFYWLINLSLKTGADLATNSLIPPNPSLANYKAIFRNDDFVRALGNSVWVAGWTTVLAITIGSFCAYALARLRFKGKFFILGLVLAITTFPGIAIAAPLFKLWSDVGLFDTLTGLIIPDLTFALPLAIFILVSFFKEIPKDLEEAALVDGATYFQAFRKVVVPLAAPGMATAAILVFIGAWNEFLFAITLTSTPQARTVPAAIAFFTGATTFEIPIGTITAASVVISIPLIVMVLLFQKRIVAGLTAGAVKG